MYLTRRFYLLFTCLTLLTGLGYAYPLLFAVARILLAVFVVVIVVDAALLYHQRGLKAERKCADRFSNGDENRVRIRLESNYPFKVWLTIIDEAPEIFQQRDINYRSYLKAKGSRTISYVLVPVQRGVYSFGKIRCFARTAIGLVERRYTLGEAKDVKVYPSYMMLNRYELLAMSNNLTEMGIKRIRRVGNNTEFEQIKE